MGFVGTEIVTQKIRNQAAVLRKYGFDERASMLDGYAAEVVRGDTANREGHAAKVYFNTLFGMSLRAKRTAMSTARSITATPFCFPASTAKSWRAAD